MMTFEASECRLVRQGMKLVAHYQRRSHLSCLLTDCCFHGWSDSEGQNDSVFVMSPLGCFAKSRNASGPRSWLIVMYLDEQMTIKDLTEYFSNAGLVTC